MYGTSSVASPLELPMMTVRNSAGEKNNNGGSKSNSPVTVPATVPVSLLKSIAKMLDIKGRSTMSRERLVVAIKAHIL